ncbi:MAG TPA: GatB/YqeY domain-containing protein [Actinomycetota bacterium]
MLRDTIRTDLTAAMKAREALRTSTLRMLLTSMKNLQVERGHELDDDEVIEVIGREAKRRREAIESFTAGGRTDQAEKEQAELAVLRSYLPEQLSEADLAALVDEAIAESGATEIKQMGAVMKALMPKVKGRADGSAVSSAVRARLGG